VGVLDSRSDPNKGLKRHPGGAEQREPRYAPSLRASAYILLPIVCANASDQLPVPKLNGHDFTGQRRAGG